MKYNKLNQIVVEDKPLLELEYGENYDANPLMKGLVNMNLNKQIGNQDWDDEDDMPIKNADGPKDSKETPASIKKNKKRIKKEKGKSSFAKLLKEEYNKDKDGFYMDDDTEGIRVQNTGFIDEALPRHLQEKAKLEHEAGKKIPKGAGKWEHSTGVIYETKSPKERYMSGRIAAHGAGKMSAMFRGEAKGAEKGSFNEAQREHFGREETKVGKKYKKLAHETNLKKVAKLRSGLKNIVEGGYDISDKLIPIIDNDGRVSLIRADLLPKIDRRGKKQKQTFSVY